MTQIMTVVERKTVSTHREIIIENIRILNSVTVNPKINAFKCSACKEAIKEKRPIAVAWAENRGWRICNDCLQKILEPKEQEAKECQDI